MYKIATIHNHRLHGTKDGSAYYDDYGTLVNGDMFFCKDNSLLKYFVVIPQEHGDNLFIQYSNINGKMKNTPISGGLTIENLQLKLDISW